MPSYCAVGIVSGDFDIAAVIQSICIFDHAEEEIRLGVII